jgi:hypothetical protein
MPTEHDRSSVLRDVEYAAVEARVMATYAAHAGAIYRITQQSTASLPMGTLAFRKRPAGGHSLWLGSGSSRRIVAVAWPDGDLKNTCRLLRLADSPDRPFVEEFTLLAPLDLSTLLTVIDHDNASDVVRTSVRVALHIATFACLEPYADDSTYGQCLLRSLCENYNEVCGYINDRSVVEYPRMPVRWEYVTWTERTLNAVGVNVNAIWNTWNDHHQYQQPAQRTLEPAPSAEGQNAVLPWEEL